MSCKAPFVSLIDLDPAPGDLIEINRVLYKHWVMYVGDGYVVHVSNEDDEETMAKSAKVFVQKSRMSKVVNDCTARINNKEESAARRGLRSRKRWHAVKEAKSCVDDRVDYSAFTTNCEYYVTLWKFGQGWSDQADPVAWINGAADFLGSDAGQTAVKVGMGVAAAGLVMGIGSLLFGEDEKKEEKEKNKRRAYYE